MSRRSLRLAAGVLRVLGVLTLAASAASAQSVRVADAGPGPGPQLLAQALAAPHATIAGGPNPHVIRADTTYGESVIAVGRTVTVEGTVHGDLIVVGGDLFMHPGGRIDGRAIAIGGGVYQSMLAHTGTVTAFRDFTYDIAGENGAYVLSYHPLETVRAASTFGLTGIQGFQIPTYDRTNGLSIPVGARLSVPHTSLDLLPSLTYRSQLGRLDPGVTATMPLDRRTIVTLDVGRGTFTNDAWIWSDLINSAEYFFVGDDARNYYRASAARLTVSRAWESAGSTLTPYIGVRAERATSVRPGVDATGGPWALLNRHDRDDVLRPNPAIDPGTTSSVLAGAKWDWSNGGVTARAALDEELGRFSPSAGVARTATASFAQTTIDGGVSFPTFGLQSLSLAAHGVYTGRGEPAQRRAYLGGPGTIPTLDLLELGGNQLVYLSGEYAIPLSQVMLPLIGSPVFTLREILAGAAENAFPTIDQATGVRVSAGFLYFEVLVDPVHHHTFKGFGISMPR